MAKEIQYGSTGVKLRFVLKSATTGAKKTGLIYNTAGLEICIITDVSATSTPYTGSNIETVVTLGTYSAPAAGKCRFREVDNVYHPGLYEFQFADSYFGSGGAKTVVVTVTGADAEGDYEIELVGYDPYTTATTKQELVDAILDELLSGHTISGSVGNGIATSSSAGDPWATTLPGSHGPGTAGYIVGTNLDTTVGTRLPTASITLTAGAVTVAANNDKTGYALSSAGVSGIWAALTSGISTVGSIGKRVVDYLTSDTSAIKTDTAAIKTKTDSMVFTAANKLDASVRDWRGSTPNILVSGKVDSNATATLSPTDITDIADAVVTGIGSSLAVDLNDAAIKDSTYDVTAFSYTAKVDFVKGASQDKYVVNFFKNGIVTTSGITNPKLTLVKADSTGTIVISATTLTQSGSQPVYFLNTSTRISGGEAYDAIVTWDIDSGTRTWPQAIRRDA